MIIYLSREANDGISKRTVVSQKPLDVWEGEGQYTYVGFFSDDTYGTIFPCLYQLIVEKFPLLVYGAILKIP